MRSKLLGVLLLSILLVLLSPAYTAPLSKPSAAIEVPIAVANAAETRTKTQQQPMSPNLMNNHQLRPSFQPYDKLKITPKTLEDIVKQSAAHAMRLKMQNMGADPRAQLDLCPTCVQVTDQIIQNLLNVILSGPIIGTCNKLCSLAVNELSGKLPDSVLQVLNVGCQLVCDYVGITQFSKLVQMADLNSIWLCQEARLCPIHDCTADVCAQFEEFRSVPEAGRMGTTFQLTGVLQVFNQTGTGEHLIQIVPPAGFPLGAGQLVPSGWLPGVYDLTWRVQITNQGRDPETPPFLPGVYRVGMVACEGQCGSKHKHTRTIAKTFGQFNVTSY